MYTTQAAGKTRERAQPQLEAAETVRLVGELIRHAPEGFVTLAQVKRALKGHVNPAMVDAAVNYLDAVGWIDCGSKGIVWIHNTHPNLAHEIARATRH